MRISNFCPCFEKSFKEKSDWLKLDSAKFLQVLDLERAKINSLPDEVGDMTPQVSLIVANLHNGAPREPLQ